MNKYNIDWTSPNAKKEYARLAYLKKVGKLRDEPAWHDEAYRDFRTGKWMVKDLAIKYGVSTSHMAAMIGKKMKRGITLIHNRNQKRPLRRYASLYATSLKERSR